MSPPLRLLASETHVWRVNLEVNAAVLARQRELLSADELQAAARFRFSCDQQRFITRRAARREILAGYCDCDASALRFSSGDCGKPELEQTPASCGIRFSCSHSEKVALVAVALDRAIGVDIEMHRARDPSLVAVVGQFSPAEQEQLRHVSSERWTTAFFDYWTCKEAFLKALGVGLSLPLHRFTVAIAEELKPRLVSLDGDPDAGNRWTLARLEMAGDGSASLAVEGRAVTVRCGSWEPA